MNDDGEVVLDGGNVNVGRVVRVGDTVRRPLGRHSAAVHCLLQHLERVGFDGAPKFLGIDDRGREVLSWIDGQPIGPQGPPLLREVRAAAALLRTVHEATASFDPDASLVWFSGADDPADGDLIVHGDFAPWNLIAGPTRWFVIDWDMARPGRRICDTSYAMHTVAHLWPGPPHWQSHELTTDEATNRIRAFAEGYGMDDAALRATLEFVPTRTASIATGTEQLAAEGNPAFARLVEDGHPEAWREGSRYTATRVHEWLQALGL